MKDNIDFGGSHIITLQTDCLMTNPATLQDKSKTLHDAYAEFWDKASGGSLELVRFFASQSLHGGYVSKRANSASYKPFLLTDRGSVFVLKLKDAPNAKLHIDEWLLQGLPDASWIDDFYKYQNKKLWERCPFLNHVGYGEVAVDLECHTKEFPK